MILPIVGKMQHYRISLPYFVYWLSSSKLNDSNIVGCISRLIIYNENRIYKYAYFYELNFKGSRPYRYYLVFPPFFLSQFCS